MPDWAVGAVLIAGFLGMLLLDQLQHRVGEPHGHGHGRGTPHLRSSDDDMEEGVPLSASTPRGVGKVGAYSWVHDLSEQLLAARHCLWEAAQSGGHMTPMLRQQGSDPLVKKNCGQARTAQGIL